MRVEQFQSENLYLRKEIDEVNEELKKGKDFKSEQEKERWRIEAISDKNPNLVNYFKKKTEEKEKDI